MVPGIAHHYVLRKQYIEATANQAIQDGVSQVVSLGAGFDTLLWRLHRSHPDITFIEIDHPATSAVKREALEADGNMGDNLHLLAVDLGEKALLGVLQKFTAFDPDRPTLFICEGVLMYLHLAAIETLLETLRRLTRHPVQFVFTAVSPISSPYSNTGPLLKVYLFFKKEPLNWTIERQDLPEFLQQRHFKTREIADAMILKERFLSDSYLGAIHQGEFLAIAEAEPLA